MKNTDWKGCRGKNAVIFGGTAGIGLATAHKLAADGAGAIILNGRNESRAAAAVAELQRAFPDCECRFVIDDMTSPVAAQHVVREAEETAGSIDIAVTAISPSVLPKPFAQYDDADIQSTLSDLMLAPIQACRHICDSMRRGAGGAIVLIASDAAKYPTPGETVIGASLAGLVMFARTLAMEEKRHAIRVNSVTPSIVDGTPLYDRLMEDAFAGRLFEKAAGQADLGVVSADEVADLVTFLCGERAAKITGQAVSVNGGVSAM